MHAGRVFTENGPTRPIACRGDGIFNRHNIGQISRIFHCNLRYVYFAQLCYSRAFVGNMGVLQFPEMYLIYARRNLYDTSGVLII